MAAPQMRRYTAQEEDYGFDDLLDTANNEEDDMDGSGLH